MRIRKFLAPVAALLLLIGLVTGQRVGRDDAAVGAQRGATASALRIRATNVVTLKEHVGRPVTVFGRVARTNKSSSGHHFLNFENTELTVICRSEDVAHFKNGTPAETFRGKDVEVTARLELYRDKLQLRIRQPDQIRIVEPVAAKNAGAAVELKQVGKDHWISPAGLVYKGYDPAGLTRVEHVERHTRDFPDRDGPHGVFEGGPAAAFGVIDEAWKIAQQRRIKPKRDGDRSLLDVSLGRRVGYLGGSVGKRRNRPPLTRVRIVFETGTKNIVTAFPKD